MYDFVDNISEHIHVASVGSPSLPPLAVLLSQTDSQFSQRDGFAVSSLRLSFAGKTWEKI
jgi:hypothetical protein